MNKRNPKYNAFGTVDLEIEHPQLGWIPFTASPDDAAGVEVHAAALAGEYGPIAAYVEPPALPATVPQTVTRFQARAALHLAGLLPTVEAIMANPDTPVLTRMAWGDALSFVRTSPTILSLAGALGLDDADLDQLFITASGIEA